ncbi:hypothetical protein FHY11_001148 [Xanthomonas arboricola]|nr:hypothetical protein [Xanthomonas euroxanthea]
MQAGDVRQDDAGQRSGTDRDPRIHDDGDGFTGLSRSIDPAGAMTLP